MAVPSTNDLAYARTLFVAFAAMAIAFVGSTLFTGWRTARIETETQTLAQNALPSVERLISAANLVRDLEDKSDDYPDLPSEQQGPARQAIENGRRAVDEALAAYLELPAFAGEREHYSDIAASLRQLDGALARVFDQVAAHDAAAARVTADRDVRTAASHTAGLLQDLVKFNAVQAYASVTQIEATRRRASQTALALDAVDVVLAAVVAFWLWRLFRAHAQLLRAHGEIVERRAEELELFGRRVAHDLLSPLSALTYCLGAFKRASDSDPTLADAMTRARACVLRAQGMVSGIFEFSRSGGHPESGARADVGETLDQIVEEVREADATDRPEVVVEPFEPCAVACSRGVLVSILSNLVRNGIKFMSDSAVKRITVRVRESTDAVRIEIEDTGPGIPAGLEGSIFEPYVRAEGVTQPGLGLGLATVKRLCEGHGGKVGVRSSAHGSVFWLTLPKANDSAVERPASSERMVRVS